MSSLVVSSFLLLFFSCVLPGFPDVRLDVNFKPNYSAPLPAAAFESEYKLKTYLIVTKNVYDSVVLSDDQYNIIPSTFDDLLENPEIEIKVEWVTSKGKSYFSDPYRITIGDRALPSQQLPVRDTYTFHWEDNNGWNHDSSPQEYTIEELNDRIIEIYSMLSSSTNGYAIMWLMNDFDTTQDQPVIDWILTMEFKALVRADFGTNGPNFPYKKNIWAAAF